jgi:hypothetical protein
MIRMTNYSTPGKQTTRIVHTGIWRKSVAVVSLLINVVTSFNKISKIS